MSASIIQQLSSTLESGGAAPKDEHLVVALPWAEPTEELERLRERFPHVKTSYRQVKYLASYWSAEGDLPADFFQTATILATLSALPKSKDEAPSLRLIHFFSAGVDHIIDEPIYKNTDITLTTSSGIHGPQIAEWVILTALAHSHKLPKLLEWQREKHWGGLQAIGPVRDMVGQKLGVLGYGSIGRQGLLAPLPELARVAKAMGLDVIAYTARPRSTKESRKDAGFIVPGTGDPDGDIPSAWFSGVEKDQLHQFLRQDIDILVISVPLTPGTTHLLSAAELDILGKNRQAFISNISRGQIVQQGDLIAALKRPLEDGGLRGAALDVTDPEPLPPESELWHLPNVIISPHISGGGTAYVDRAFQVLEENLDRIEKGKALLNVVDRRKGY
ncbi:MAG: hypothetical protein M1825_006121 [Sarcosagium campestre]|nr:MAG: hypothetical protein M1825_006121 [Sarcosagium campestre]